MKRIVLLSIPLAFLAACSPAQKSGCKETGCNAGTVCNTTSNACETIVIGGGGGGTGGGSGGGSTGDGGSSLDAGFDAGMGVDPIDDGGVFVAGDICANAIPVTFDGGAVTTASVDLAAATDQYAAACNTSSGANDLIFEVNLTERKGLIVTATDTSGKTQDGVLSLIRAPCASLDQAACADNASTGPEVLTAPSLPQGRWYVLLENGPGAHRDGTFDVQFELIDAVAGPPNDFCSAAQALTFTGGIATATGTTSYAFNDTSGHALSCSSISAVRPDVFYSFTLAQPQDVRVTIDMPLSSTFTPAIALTTVCGQGGASVERGCDTSTGVFTARNLAVGTYYVVVDGDGPYTGAFDLEVMITPPLPLAMNDTCAMPSTLVPNVSQMIDANAGASDYTFSCASNTSGGDVVYQFTTTTAQKVTITATGVGDADAVISLRGAPCDDDTGEVDCVDTYHPVEELSVPNLPAGTYYVVLAAYDSSDGEFGVELRLEPPVIP